MDTKLSSSRDTLIINSGFALLWSLTTIIVFPSVINSSLIAALFCLATYKYWTKEFARLLRETKLVWPGILIFVAIGVVGSELPEKSAKGAYDILRCIALFYFITPFLRKTSNEALLKSLHYFLLFASFLSFAAVIWIQLSEQTILIRESQTGHLVFSGYHHFVNSVAVIFILAFCLTISKSLSWHWTLPIFLLLFYCLLFSYSRGNWLAIFFVVTFLISYQKKVLFYSWFFLVILFYLSYYYIFYLFPCPETSCNITIFNRQHIYRNTLELIETAPFFGFGISVFKIISEIKEAGLKVVMPHNIFLESLYSVGIIGTASLIGSFSVFIIKSGWLKKTILPERPLPIHILISISLLIYLAIRGTFDLKLADSPTFGIIAISMAFLYSRKPNCS